MSEGIVRIEPFRISKLTDVIAEEVLQMIQSGLSEHQGIPLIIVEKRKNKWHPIGPVTFTQNYCDFCKLFRGKKDSESDKECIACDAQQANRVLKGHDYEPFWYLCHMKLADVIFPIVIGGKIVALFLSGQKRLEGMDREVEAQVRQRAGKYKHVRSGKMMKLLRGMKLTTESEIKAFMDELAPMVNHIKELGEQNYSLKKRLQEEGFLNELPLYFQHPYSTDINSLWDVLETVLQRINQFTHTEVSEVNPFFWTENRAD